MDLKYVRHSSIHLHCLSPSFCSCMQCYYTAAMQEPTFPNTPLCIIILYNDKFPVSARYQYTSVALAAMFTFAVQE